MLLSPSFFSVFSNGVSNGFYGPCTVISEEGGVKGGLRNQPGVI